MTGNDLSYRRAIEALRAGVPNRDAVRVLGCSQPDIQERFEHQLEESKALASEAKQVPGLVISGGFGTGKSHLLEHLHHLALEQNFVSSKIVISKETPLYDPAKLYRAAIDAAVVPDKQGSAAVRWDVLQAQGCAIHADARTLPSTTHQWAAASSPPPVRMRMSIVSASNPGWRTTQSSQRSPTARTLMRTAFLST